MRTTYITATVIALLLAGWLLSGQLNKEEATFNASLAEQNREQERVDADAAPTRVRVAVVQASEQQRFVKVRGKTENKRTVTAKIELPGTILSRPVERGATVAKGQLLCELSLEDREVALTEAKAGLAQARLEYKGALSLKKKGFNSDTAIAGARARLATAEANLNRRQLDLSKVKIRAPFDGIVEDVHMEVGDYATPGSNCATIVDLNPMLLRGRVSEVDVASVTVGGMARGVMRDGNQVEGPVTFVGHQSDPATRTYALEIELPNDNGALRSGITTEILIPVESVLAQKISPALFSLSDAGDIGVKVINSDNVVEYHKVTILSDDNDGVWVTGLPNRTALITVGQELVTDGERVDPVYQGTNTMPAQGQAPDGSATDTGRAQLPTANAVSASATL